VEEREADDFAGEVLLPGHEYADFLTQSDHSEEAIRSFAQRISVHPSIVLGRLQRDGEVPHRANRLHQWFEWHSD